jgi:hypothetical protein
MFLEVLVDFLKSHASFTKLVDFGIPFPRPAFDFQLSDNGGLVIDFVYQLPN